MLKEEICKTCSVPAELACKCEDRYRLFCFDHPATHLKEANTKHTLPDISEAKNDTQLEKRKTLLKSIQKEFEEY